MPTPDFTIQLERFVHLRELNRLFAKTRQRRVKLRIPNTQQKDTPFLDASLAQFYASLGRWDSNHTEILLHLDIGPDLDAFCRTLPGMTLGMTTVPVRFANGRNARPALDETTRKVLDDYQQRGFDALPDDFRRTGMAFFLSCDTDGFGRPGYFDLSDSSEPITRGVFLNGQQNLLEFLTEKSGHRSRVVQARADLLQKLGIVFHELLTNAWKFAKLEIDGRPIDRAFRALSYRFFSPASNRSAAEDPPINDYLGSFRPEFTTFLEICFWDTGPGLARHYLSHGMQTEIEELSPERISPGKEVQGTITCFNKLKSAEAELGQGFGLNDVMRQLSRVQGLIRVRTGRLDLFRNLSAEPYDSDPRARGVTFRHLETGTDEPHFGGWAWGTLFSVVVPWK